MSTINYDKVFKDAVKNIYNDLEKDFNNDLQKNKADWVINKHGDDVYNKLRYLSIGYPHQIVVTNHFIREILECFDEYYFRMAINPQIAEFIPQIKEIRKKYVEQCYKSDVEPDFLSKSKENDWVLLCAKYCAYKNFMISLDNFPNAMDDRIKGKLPKDDVEKYFMKLNDYSNKEQKARVQVLTKEQVSHLLHANFVGFFPKKEVKKFDTPLISQGELRRFVYVFFTQHSSQNRTEEYVYFLINNFSKFDKTEFNTLKRNFSKK